MFNPFQLTFLRFLFGGLFLLTIVIIKNDLNKFNIPLKKYLQISLIGSINSIIAMSLLQVSVKYSSSSTAAILVSANPVFVLILAPIILKEKITFKKVVALYTVIVKKFLFDIDTMVFQTISFLGSSIFFYIILKIFHVPVFDFKITFNTIFLLTYISIFITGIAYITFFKALSILEASLSSFSYLLKPVISITLAYLFLKEIPNQMKLAGTFLIIISILIILLKRQNDTKIKHIKIKDKKI